MSEKATEKTEFLSLQDELNQVEKSFNSVEKTEIQQERISKKLDTIMQKINELTTNKEQALQKKELVELNWQIERIKIIAGIEQEKTQKEINLLKGTIGKQPIFPWSQEFLRENGYTPENLARVEAAKKIIEAGIPGMDFLLS